MKKYTKEISALLTLVTAGIIGGSVYAADISESRTAGDTVASPPEETELVMGNMMYYETTDTDNNTPDVGVAMPVTTTDDELTPEIGEIMPDTSDTDNNTPEVGVAMAVTKCTDKYCEETEITPTMGVAIPTTKCTDKYCEETEITPTMGVIMPVSDVTPVSTVPASKIPTVTGPQSNTSVRGRGDIDGSGQTDLSDLIILSQYLLGDRDLDESALIEADMTKDGKVDITDLPAMKMKIMIPETSNTTPGQTVTTPVTTVPDTEVSQIPAETTTTPPPVHTTIHSTMHMGIISTPLKTVYKIGEQLDLTGGGVLIEGVTCEGVDVNGTLPLEPSKYMKIDSSSFNNQVPGTYDINVTYSYKDIQCGSSFEVTVVE